MKSLFAFKQTEAEITKEIRAYLRMIPGFWYKQWQGMGSLPGVADIIGCWKGRYVAIEVKGPKGVITDKQKIFLDRVKMEGGIAFVARSVEDVIQELRDAV